MRWRQLAAFLLTWFALTVLFMFLDTRLRISDSRSFKPHQAAPEKHEPVPEGKLAPDPTDPSIVISEVRPTIHEKTVENGDAFDQAALAIGQYKKVVIPDNAAVQRSGRGDKLQIFMRKSMGFHGHPPESMSIRTARKNMGCAVKHEGGSLLLATFGEWDSHIEGGTRMDVKLLVPEGVDVEKRGGLSGEHSAGREWHGAYLTKPKDVKEGWWYGPASPAEGWKAIPDVPDPLRRAATP